MRPWIPFFLLFLILPCSLNAQYDPQIDWKVINTPYHRIIFPEEMMEKGIRVAALTDWAQPLITQTLQPVHPYSYPVILTGRDMTTNGYVTVFPRRSVWYGLPPEASLGTTDWYETLALHEGRHMVQFDTLNSSTSRVLHVLGGESWASLAIGVTPSWIFEGDAVRSETLYSLSGRGRLGSFSEGLRAIVREDRDYSYYKMLHRSYKDFVPNAYVLGYHMLEKTESSYGPDTAQSIFSSIAQLPFPLLGYSRAIRKTTGLPPRKLYKEMMAGLKREDRLLLEQKGRLIEGDLVSAPSKTYTSRSYLIDGEGDLWYEYRSDMIKPGALYEWREGESRPFLTVSPATRIDGGGGYFVWDSVKSSHRYPERQESDIYLYSPEGGIEKITRAGQYYSPALSQKGEYIAALERLGTGETQLVIMKRTGEIIKRRAFPEGIGSAQWPVWTEENEILLIVHNGQGEAVWRYHRDRGFTGELPFTPDDLGRPEPWEGGFFFTLDRNPGREICYSKNGVVFRVTNSAYGADSPRVDVIGTDRLLYVSTEGSLGDAVRALSLEDLFLEEEIVLRNIPETDGEKEIMISEKYDREDVEDYNAHRFFSPVAWGFNTMQMPRTDDLEIPFTLISANEMQTVFWETGVYYNLNEESFNYRFSGLFGLAYPWISLQAGLNERTREGTVIHDALTSGGLMIPMGFTRGKDSFQVDLTTLAGYQYSWSDNMDISFFTLYEEIGLSHSRSGGYRSLQPRWEEYAGVSLRHGLVSFPLINMTGELHLLTPGLWPTHGLGLYAYYEKNPRLLSSNLPGARGYAYSPLKEQILLRAEYLVPLFYPDVGGGGLFYVPRVKGELFYDRSIDLEGGSKPWSSSGFELTCETYLLSLPVKLEGGVRFNWLWEENKPVIDVVIEGSRL